MKKELLLEERKEVSLKILKKIDLVCRKHGIRYYLGYGTLIGAVRHKGFIPWDDDIDIWVMWKDYNRILDILGKETRYEILSDRTDRQYPHLFAKVSDPDTTIEKIVKTKGDFRRGIGVDVFPLCPFTDNKEFRRRYSFLITANKVFGKAKMTSGKPRKSMKDRAVLIGSKAVSAAGIGDRFWRKKLESFLNHALDYAKESELLFSPFSPYRWRDVHRRSDFEDIVDLQFEDCRFRAPKGYDNILRDIYGDYMQLPPVEKRSSGHDVVAYRIRE